MRAAPNHPATNTDFGSAALHAIATDPRLAKLRTVLVLKGGAALLLGYDSGRATRRDLDFDVRSQVAITDADAAALLNALDAWNARNADIVRPGLKAQKIRNIAFTDPRSGDEGTIEIQISKRNIPPTLHHLIRDLDYGDPLTGRRFQFPTMSREAIAAENAVRVFKVTDKDGNAMPLPPVNDLYDIGFIAETYRALKIGEVKTAFNLLCADEAKEGKTKFVLDPAQLDQVARRAMAAKTTRDLMGDGRVLQGVTFETARRRVLTGIRSVKGLVGLPAVLPPPPGTAARKP